MSIINNQKGKLSAGAIVGIVIGCIALVIVLTIVVIVVLSGIVMNSSSNQISQAIYAAFVQQFGEYSDQVIIDSAQIMSNVAKNGHNINTAQRFYMVANGFEEVGAENDEQGVEGYSVPVGYVLTDETKEALSIAEDNVVAYLIDDSKITGYENSNLRGADFYGDENGVEHHLVTSNGVVFTIPGFSEEQEDGSVKYYITSRGDFYTVEKDSKEDIITAEDFEEMLGIDLNEREVKKSVIYKKGLQTK